MSTTTHLYAAARSAHLDGMDSPATTAAGQASRPPHSDQTIQDGTGRSWDQWVAEIDAGPGRAATHTQIAAWVEAHSDVGPWWAQGITVGYERLTGRRLPGQMPDGTFTAARSRTLAVDTQTLRARLEDDTSRAALLPDAATTRMSKPGVKSPRYALTDRAGGAALGVVQFSCDAAGAKTRLTVTHSDVPHADAAEAWKAFWAQWLDAVEEQAPAAR